MVVLRAVGRAIVCAAASILAALANGGHCAVLYSETIVQNFEPTAISPTGVMVGTTFDPLMTYYHAATYTNGKVIDLGTNGGPNSIALAQNSSGLTVGSTSVDYYSEHVTSWQYGITNDLGCVRQCFYNEAKDVNDSGTIVGYGGTGGSVFRGFIYENGSFTVLGTLGGAYSSAQAINSSGEIVGYASTKAGDFHAAIFQNGNVIDLDKQAGRSSEADAVSGNGTVAGYVDQSGVYDPQAAVWNAKGLTVLGDPGSMAQGINDSGQVVGFALNHINSLGTAYIWSNGHGQYLNSLVQAPDAELVQAVGINNSGQIAAIGLQGPCDEEYAPCRIVGVLLNPLSSPGAVPEPASWAMVVIGFGLAGGIMRYRCQDAQHQMSGSAWSSEPVEEALAS